MTFVNNVEHHLIWTVHNKLAFWSALCSHVLGRNYKILISTNLHNIAYYAHNYQQNCNVVKVSLSSCPLPHIHISLFGTQGKKLAKIIHAWKLSKCISARIIFYEFVCAWNWAFIARSHVMFNNFLVVLLQLKQFIPSRNCYKFLQHPVLLFITPEERKQQTFSQSYPGGIVRILCFF